MDPPNEFKDAAMKGFVLAVGSEHDKRREMTTGRLVISNSSLETEMKLTEQKREKDLATSIVRLDPDLFSNIGSSIPTDRPHDIHGTGTGRRGSMSGSSTTVTPRPLLARPSSTGNLRSARSNPSKSPRASASTGDLASTRSTHSTEAVDSSRRESITGSGSGGGGGSDDQTIRYNPSNSSRSRAAPAPLAASGANSLSAPEDPNTLVVPKRVPSPARGRTATQPFALKKKKSKKQAAAAAGAVGGIGSGLNVELSFRMRDDSYPHGAAPGVGAGVGVRSRSVSPPLHPIAAVSPRPANATAALSHFSSTFEPGPTPAPAHVATAGVPVVAPTRLRLSDSAPSLIDRKPSSGTTRPTQPPQRPNLLSNTLTLSGFQNLFLSQHAPLPSSGRVPVPVTTQDGGAGTGGGGGGGQVRSTTAPLKRAASAGADKTTSSDDDQPIRSHTGPLRPASAAEIGSSGGIRGVAQYLPASALSSSQTPLHLVSMVNRLPSTVTFKRVEMSRASPVPTPMDTAMMAAATTAGVGVAGSVPSHSHIRPSTAGARSTAATHTGNKSFSKTGGSIAIAAGATNPRVATISHNLLKPKSSSAAGAHTSPYARPFSSTGPITVTAHTVVRKNSSDQQQRPSSVHSTRRPVVFDASRRPATATGY